MRTSYRQRLAALEASRLINAKVVLARYDAILAQNQTLLTQRQRPAEALEIKTKRGQLTVAWLTPPASATANSGLVKGLIAWWKAEGKAQDGAGNHHGTLVGGATFADGKDGPAFSFNSATAGVSVPGSPAFDFGDKDFSIALWAKFSALASSQALLSSDDGAKQANQWVFWLNDGQLQWKMTGSAVSQLGSAKFAPVIDRWYRLAMIRAGAMFRFYIDGVEVSSQSWPGKIPGLGGPLTIGNAAGAFPFSGQLADIRIYSRALSAVEIEAWQYPVSPLGSAVFSSSFWLPLSGKAKDFSEPRRLEYLPSGWVRVLKEGGVSSPKRGKNIAMRARFKFIPGVLNQVHVRDDGAWNSYIAVINDTGATASITIQTKGNSPRMVKTLATYPLGALISSGDEYKLELHAVGDEITIFVNDRRLGSVRDSTHTNAGLCSVYIGRGEYRDLAWRDLDSDATPP